MVNISRNRVPKPPLQEWTTREKLCLASLALKHGNAWNSVARNMQSFVEKGRPDGWSNQKTCAAQYDKLMNELGVDKRPRRNEPSDGNSNNVIYKKMVEKRIKELEENIIKSRKLWLDTKKELDASKPTRAVTRRTSSRQNLEKTLETLCESASDINLFPKPSELYDQVILKHMDISVIKKRLGGVVDDPYAIMNDLLLMFQNATMFYPPDHQMYKNAVELREKLVPQWEKALLDKFKSRH